MNWQKTDKDTIQEKEYDFPYHHLVNLSPFSLHKELFWGYQYAGYIEKIIKALGDFKFDSIIDIGCGDGRITKEISKTFPTKRVVGVDYSEKSLGFAKAFSPKLEFKNSTKEKFDGFVLAEVLEHIDPLKMNDFLAGICKNLNEGGFGIITTPSDNTPINIKHYKHYNKEQITDTLLEYFNVISIKYISTNSFGVNLIQRILSNRFYTLNHKLLIDFLYRTYKKYYLDAKPHNAKQLFIIVRKK